MKIKRTKTRLRLRLVKLTHEEFDKLPALVSRSEFQEWTGLGDRDLKLLIEHKQIEIYHPRGATGYAKYYKREIGRLIGFNL